MPTFTRTVKSPAVPIAGVRLLLGERKSSVGWFHGLESVRSEGEAFPVVPQAPTWDLSPQNPNRASAARGQERHGKPPPLNPLAEEISLGLAKNAGGTRLTKIIPSMAQSPAHHLVSHFCILFALAHTHGAGTRGAQQQQQLLSVLPRAAPWPSALRRPKPVGATAPGRQ